MYFMINRRLLKALYAEHGEKDRLINALIERELVLQRLIRLGLTFDQTHRYFESFINGIDIDYSAAGIKNKDFQNIKKILGSIQNMTDQIALLEL